MDPHAATLVQTLKGMVREDPRSVFDDREEFRYFAMLRIKCRAAIDISFAREVEEEDGRNY
ncbi:hypothetical protein A2U01_0008214 [Trifolium medium]|uniref:Uncharacterized protein n=1 Tax=Trifolium medium TaxID=97028 RepID=A0A392MIK4_9FABA|nr:hypothetical protein [Trifolium medium]